VFGYRPKVSIIMPLRESEPACATRAVGVNLYHAHVASIESQRLQAIPVIAERASSERRPAKFLADPEFDRRASLFRYGTGAAQIKNVELLGPGGRRLVVLNFGTEVTVRIHAAFYEDVPISILGFLVRDKNGVDVIGTNTYEEGRVLPPRRSGDALVVDFQQHLPLQPGTYSVSVALSYSSTQPAYMDWVDNCLVFEVLPPGLKQIHAKVWLPVEISIHA